MNMSFCINISKEYDSKRSKLGFFRPNSDLLISQDQKKIMYFSREK